MMRRSSSVVLFCLCHLFVFCFAGDIFGLSPEDKLALKYDEKEFHCKSGKVIPFDQVNDNYCDCEVDGSDEPGTPACPNGQFYCTNVGFKPSKIFSSQVWDGICDCCDGVDEKPEVNCPNTCRQKAEESMKSQIEEYNRQKEGLKLKAEYIAQANAAFAAKETELAEKKKNLEDLQTQKQPAEEAKNKAEEAERIMREQINQRKAEEAAKNPPPEPTPTEATPAPEGETQPTGAVPDGVQDNTQDSLHAEIVDHDHEPATSEPATPEPTVEPASPAEKLSDEGIEDDDDEELVPLIEASKKAREEFDNIQRQINDVERDIKSIQDLLNTDFGSQKEFYYLKGKCFSADTVEYTYELCPFDRVAQKSKQGGGSTSLGTWDQSKQTEEWTVQRKVMVYTDGLRCWGGPDRSTKVEILCGSEDSVADPTEPNKCEYHLKFRTPAGCNEQSFAELEKELGDLIKPASKGWFS